MSQVGARARPTATRVCSANGHGAVGDGASKSTAAIQRAIDACSAAGGGTVRLDAGRYVTGALFLTSGVHLLVDSGVTLLGSEDDADYPTIPTRVAGIEMRMENVRVRTPGGAPVRIANSVDVDAPAAERR